MTTPLLSLWDRTVAPWDRSGVAWGRSVTAVGSYRIWCGSHLALCDRNGVVWSSLRALWDRNGIVWGRYGGSRRTIYRRIGPQWDHMMPRWDSHRVI